MKRKADYVAKRFDEEYAIRVRFVILANGECWWLTLHNEQGKVRVHRSPVDFTPWDGREIPF